MRLSLAVCALGVLVSCGGGTTGSGLTLKVDVSASNAQCVTAGVRLASGTVFESAPVKRGKKSTLTFGVLASASIKGKVTPFAHGFVAADCTQLDTSRFDESVSGSVIDLDKAGVQTATLALKASALGDGGFDGGGIDGGTDAGTDAGIDAGVDAGTDAGCVPAAQENCLDGVDNTCNGLVDCADPGCAAMACAGGGTCGAISDGGRACLQAMETSCADLVDNDGDQLADCLDPDCGGKACNDGNLCTASDFCSGTVCDGGAPSACLNPLPNCKAAVGACVPATGLCAFDALDAGQACSDGVACTAGDHCNAAGVCAGTLYACATGPCVDAGTCLGDGGCAFVFSPATQACDDTASCTHTDRCDGTGVCSGTAYSCASPPVCFSGSTCLGDGGCGWTFNGVDSGCPGGSCGPDAGCVPTPNPGFQYAPSNFDPDFIPDASIAPATVFTGCTVAFDTTNNTFVDGGWCGQTKPTPFTFTQDGGIATSVLAMRGFDLSANSTLIVSGSRPLILAVFGNASIQGTIDARSVDVTRVGPGGNFAGCGLGDGRDALFAGGGGGAGFGTIGGPGAGTGAGQGGTASPNNKLVPLRGGCQGGLGHDDSNRTNAPGGSGGGAVQIAVARTFLLGGVIAVSGAGGRGGSTGAANNVGGGGGGSGGAILCEAGTLIVQPGAKLIANGGAGGGGRIDGSNVTGFPGSDGALSDAVPALGGMRGTPPAGDGGSGAAGSVAFGAAAPGVGFAGSGGGGAGLGVIRLNGYAACTIADAGVLLSGASSRSALCP